MLKIAILNMFYITVHWGLSKVYNFPLDSYWNYWDEAKNFGPEFPTLLYSLSQVAEKVGHIQKSSLEIWCQVTGVSMILIIT